MQQWNFTMCKHPAAYAYTFPNGSTLGLAIAREPGRIGWVTGRTYTMGATPVYGWQASHDALGRPVSTADSESAARSWTYNERSEMTGCTGEDLSGTEQGAGNAPVAKRSGRLSEANPKGRKGPRVGGLLAVSCDGKFYVPIYGGNGNIMGYVDDGGAFAVKFEYDPYGDVVSIEDVLSAPMPSLDGSPAPIPAGLRGEDFSFGFSTKYHDREVGLVAYQLRSYSPVLGRWLNRDPIEEEGGGNLYQFNLNSPLVSFDTLGEKPISQCKLNGIPISFVFNGVTLTGNGFSTPAVSGRPVKTKRTSWVSTIKILGSPALGGIDSEYTFDYSASRQKLRNEGPLPVGPYWIDVDEKRSAGTSKYSHIILHKAWGSYSWSLHPEAGTQTHGRSGFFIHGGLNWGSAGCIDIKSGDVKFNDFLKGLCKCYISIIVKYELQQDKKTEREITWHYNLAPYNVPYVR